MKMTLDEKRLKELVIDYWRASPGNWPVKVTSAAIAPSLFVAGYFTSRKFVAGRTPRELEAILGLPTNVALAAGACVYTFLTLPSIHQFDLRGLSTMPGGKPFVPGGMYPPGTGAPQWRITPPHLISARVVCFVPPSGRVPTA